MFIIKVSIIIPVYKAEKNISRCIDSILKQSYENLEVILIDDGSPDDSGKICDKYSEIDKRIKVIHKKNGGVSSARNAGLKIATGDYIGFVDADDYIEADMYSHLIDLIQKSNADLVICGYFIEYLTGVIKESNIIDKHLLNTEETLDFVLTNLNMGSIWNKIYKREIIYDKNVIFDESITIGEDLLFLCMAISNCNRVVYDFSPKYHYLMNIESAMNSDFKINRLSVIKAHLLISNMIKDKYPNLVKKVKNRLVSSCINLVIQIVSMEKSKDEIINEPIFYIKKGLKDYIKSKSTIKMKLYAILISIHPKIFCVFWRYFKLVISVFNKIKD